VRSADRNQRVTLTAPQWLLLHRACELGQVCRPPGYQPSGKLAALGLLELVQTVERGERLHAGGTADRRLAVFKATDKGVAALRARGYVVDPT
jgi:hypothetical protein